MNNLLRTLTESQVKPVGDLRLLLNTVKEGRRQNVDSKLTDPFYDSLDGLLADLRTITVDNHDAEAFLKPVSRVEVPDYYDVIQNPMDFQTMQKKVKQKQYKSKREFKDDLDLIWSNCLTYNAAENHPLRPCVKRLKAKAEKLLKYITDRKERADPPIPSDLPSSSTGVVRPRVNGTTVNGRASHTRSPSIVLASKTGTPSIIIPPRPRRDVEFGESPAIIRTVEGMKLFADLEREVSSGQPRSTTVHTLRALAPVMEDVSDGEVDAMDVDIGHKRKNGSSEKRPRKKARFTNQYPTPLADEKDDLTQLWWGAVQSDTLLGCGLPGIPFGPSSSKLPKTKRKSKREVKPPPPQNPKSLLYMMNNNIKTMRRVRHTHAKFAALNAATTGAADEDDPMGESSNAYPVTPAGGFMNVDDEVVQDNLDESPWSMKGKAKGKRKMVGGVELGVEHATDCLKWTTSKILEHSGFQGTSSVALDVLSDVAAEYLLNVGKTIRFLTDKFGKTMSPEEIILHTLFESGNSKIQDLERYISDDIERYGSRLGELEKKLVTAYRETNAEAVPLDDEGLFEEEDDEEAGVLAMGEFADMLGEDYLGLRELGIAAELGLSNLSIPKKLLKGRKGQNKPTAAKPTEPPPPYPPPPPFIPLTAGKVEDQIGLLKGYYQARFVQLAAAQAPTPSQPPQPGAPIPAPAAPALPGPSLAGPTLPPSNTLPGTSVPPPAPPAAPPVPQPPQINPDLVLPDELPSSAQMKMGPIGQIVKSGAGSGGAAKKKEKEKPKEGAGSGSVPPGGGGGGAQAVEGAGASPAKKAAGAASAKKPVAVGSGPGRKKKAPAAGEAGASLPPVVFAT
ncbi:hypothetical protein D9613_001187 [Agrocybe pediades]|uniref:Bromo domain-containing protein n=1 Tax=Agrocybe pediades TaxID=84607 RepID=A0A8H4VSF2_9AGAR|nr:hypothetical protein D9613_001187 [Agrocybe pediades]